MSTPIDPFEPFASATRPHATDFGDQLYELLGGTDVVVVTQPAYAVVTLYPPNSWEVAAGAVPAPVAGRADSFTVSVGGGPPVAVPLSYQDLDA